MEKGWWGEPAGLIGQGLFDGGLGWPVLTVRRSAVAANVAAFARFCADRGVRHAPHAKTAMAPSLVTAQLAAGAWGITAATAHQARVLRAYGVPRVLLANELPDVRALRWAAGEVARGWRFCCYVDSSAGVEALRDARPAAPLDVLVELGHPGGRTGCRSVAAAVVLARDLSTVDGARLAGVAGYEGGLSDPDAVRAFLGTLRAAAGAVAPYVRRDPVVVSAGGTVHADVVAAELAGQWLPGRRVEAVLRSGAYAVHDDGFYAGRVRALPLRPALRLWAQVLSTPEDGLAVVGMGKRDAPYDLGLPVPLEARGADGRAPRAVTGAVVTALDDHHAYVRGLTATPGDLVCFGVSHPCTALDRWRAVPVVDDDDRVVDVWRTHF